jgi:tyrosyl-tRNA synthetase
MYGKVMSLPDAAMLVFWRLAADLPAAELDEVERELGDPAVHPMALKKKLAERIVALYHGADAAARARESFEAQFSRRETPEELEEFGRDDVLGATKNDKPNVLDLAAASGMAPSRSALRRLFDQGAVDLDGVRVTVWDEPVDLGSSHVLRIGRRMKRYVPR